MAARNGEMGALIGRLFNLLEMFLYFMLYIV